MTDPDTMSGCSVLSVGDCVKEGAYALHSSFESAANFVSGDGAFACLLPPEKGGGPFNITVLGCDFQAVRRLEVRLPEVSIDGVELRCNESYRSSVRFPRTGSAYSPVLPGLEAQFLMLAAPMSLAVVLDHSRLCEFRPGFDRSFAEQALRAASRLAAGDLCAGAKLLNGLGYGFTPSGDDFLCGFMLSTHFSKRGHAVRESVYTAVSSSNPAVSAAFSAAYLGKASEQVGRFVSCLADGKYALPALERSLAAGSTSGADFVAGLLFGFKCLKGDADADKRNN